MNAHARAAAARDEVVYVARLLLELRGVQVDTVRLHAAAIDAGRRAFSRDTGTDPVDVALDVADRFAADRGRGSFL